MINLRCFKWVIATATALMSISALTGCDRAGPAGGGQAGDAAAASAAQSSPAVAAPTTAASDRPAGASQ